MADLSFLSDHIHLVAIHPESRATIGQYFGKDRDLAEQWARAYNDPSGGWGIYWTVNEVRPDCHKKPTKADIIRVRYWHADLDDVSDPSLLVTMGASLIINSGNGLQPLWCVHGDVSVAECEDINRRIAAAIGADHCWNVDRLLRVPGTINWPNPVKRARGRVPVDASLVVPPTGTQYSLASMAASFAPLAPRANGPSEAAEAVLGDWVPLRLADIKPPPAARLMMLCETVPAKGERSEHVSRACVALASNGYTNEQIMGLLMHPENRGLNEHIADQPDPERAARRKLALGVAARPDPASAFAKPAEPPGAMRPEPPKVEAARKAGLDPRGGDGFIHPDKIPAYFAGCTYVEFSNEVLMPDGRMLDQSRFDSVMGGYRFVFQVEGRPTKSAWEAFLRNEHFVAPRVRFTCFRPELPRFAVVVESGVSYINTYVPIETPRSDDDVTPFIAHLIKMFPNNLDYRILLTYMASMVQNPGVKFPWALVIQGAEGNGKSMLIEVLINAIGQNYCHLPATAKMTRTGINFNSWIYGKLFIGMEEIYSAQRRQFLEEFKPYVTNRLIGVEKKGVDEVMLDNRANMLFLTNHQDGVPIDDNTRRYCVLFTAQQRLSDLNRDGMTEAYFHGLWAWLKSGGYAAVNGYLRRYACEAQFDPAQMASRAPRTTSTANAVRASLGNVEQMILEAIEEGQPGFSGGWVSGIMLGKLLERRKIYLPPGKRAEILERLGYWPHPHLLNNGRSPNIVQPDNGRPRLFTKSAHLSYNFKTQADIARAYEIAQSDAQSVIVKGRFETAQN